MSETSRSSDAASGSASSESDVEGWRPSTVTTAGDVTTVGDDTRLAPWALLAAIIGLGASFFVGWAVPVAVVAVIAAIMALRRPVESRAMARWALVLGLCATLYSVGWLIWAAVQLGFLG